MMLPDDVKLYIEAILKQAKNGIILTDCSQGDLPLIYVNKAFVDLFGYTEEEVIGKNCRFLHKNDTEQKGLILIREAIAKREPVTVIVRNYTKSNTLIYNEISISPIFDENKKLKYFLGIQKDVTREQKLLKQLQELFSW